MAEVGAKTGLTLKIWKDANTYDFWRPEVYIDKINTEGDVPAQIKKALEALEQVDNSLTEYLTKMTKIQLEYLQKELERATKK